MKLSQAFQVTKQAHIALVGGGGKSSTMFKLGAELATMGRRVLLTTTTRIFASQINQAAKHIIFNPQQTSFSQLLTILKETNPVDAPVLLVGAIDKTQNKAAGIDPHHLDALFKSNLFEVIINEADGSRMRPFKAPAAHEPVIPGSSTLVVPVVGLDVIGKPLNEQHVHRPALVRSLSNTAQGEAITPAMIGRVLNHPQGGLKDIPPKAKVIPLLNRLDLAQQTDAQETAKAILKGERITQVVAGQMTHPQPVAWVKRRIAIIILAAGQASRFGSPKQLALWHGKPLLRHAVETALTAAAGPVFVVLGAHTDKCLPVLAGTNVTIIINKTWAQGQSTSLQAGLKALPPNTHAALFLLADQPLVTPKVIQAVVQRYQETLAPVVWPEYEGKRGNPVLFDEQLFRKMHQVEGDVGARPVLQAYQTQGTYVSVTNAGILKDVDTPADL